LGDAAQRRASDGAIRKPNGIAPSTIHTSARPAAPSDSVSTAMKGLSARAIAGRSPIASVTAISMR